MELRTDVCALASLGQHLGEILCLMKAEVPAFPIQSIRIFFARNLTVSKHQLFNLVWIQVSEHVGRLSTHVMRDHYRPAAGDLVNQLGDVFCKVCLIISRLGDFTQAAASQICSNNLITVRKALHHVTPGPPRLGPTVQ